MFGLNIDVKFRYESDIKDDEDFDREKDNGGESNE